VQDAETVVWTPKVRVDQDNGDYALTDGRPVRLQALVAARTNVESVGQNSPGVVVGKSLYLLDAVTEPGPSDTFQVRGQTYEVVGEAHRWGSGGVEVAIQRAGQS
jgi:hypothetical protein